MKLFTLLLGPKALARALGLAFGLPALTAALTLGPWSPWALDQADGLAARGQTKAALGAYERVASFSPWEEDQAEALLRGALLAAAEGDNAHRGVRLLNRLLREHPEHPTAQDARERLAALLASELRSPGRAATTFAEAARLSEDPELTGRLWLLAAEAHERADERDAARLAAERAAEEPTLLRAPRLLQARLKLTVADYAGARSLFVAVHSDPEASPSERKVAALGLTMCLQDLGDLEAAALVDSLSTGEDPTLGRRLARALERREGIRR